MTFTENCAQVFLELHILIHYLSQLKTSHCVCKFGNGFLAIHVMTIFYYEFHLPFLMTAA